jgi:hypothetical protein
MKALRKVLGVVVLLMAVAFGAAGAMALMQQYGGAPQVARLQPYLAKAAELHGWLIAVCGAVALFWLVSAVSLLRNTRQAFVPYLAGFVGVGVLWWFVHQAPEYGLALVLAGREHEIAFWAGLVLLGLLIWLTDRRKRYRPSAD